MSELIQFTLACYAIFFIAADAPLFASLRTKAPGWLYTAVTCPFCVGFKAGLVVGTFIDLGFFVTEALVGATATLLIDTARTSMHRE